MMRRTKKISPLPTYSVIGDGETEQVYFSMIKRNASGIRVNLLPQIPQRKSLHDQYNLVIQQASIHTTVFWIVDLDTVLKETRETKRGQQTPTETFKVYTEILSKKYKNVVIIVNNPCIEFWFLMHYERSTKFYDNCAAAENRLKKYLPGYEKSKQYLTRNGNDIFLQLRDNLPIALKNAASLGYFDPNNPYQAKTEMFKFFNSDPTLLKLASDAKGGRQ